MGFPHEKSLIVLWIVSTTFSVKYCLSLSFEVESLIERSILYAGSHFIKVLPKIFLSSMGKHCTYS